MIGIGMVPNIIDVWGYDRDNSIDLIIQDMTLICRNCDTQCL